MRGDTANGTVADFSPSTEKRKTYNPFFVGAGNVNFCEKSPAGSSISAEPFESISSEFLGDTNQSSFAFFAAPKFRPLNAAETSAFFSKIAALETQSSENFRLIFLRYGESAESFVSSTTTESFGTSAAPDCGTSRKSAKDSRAAAFETFSKRSGSHSSKTGNLFMSSLYEYVFHSVPTSNFASWWR